MNAPPTFESFLLFDGEKKYLTQFTADLSSHSKMFDFYLISKNYNRERFESTERRLIHCQQGRSYNCKHGSRVSRRHLLPSQF